MRGFICLSGLLLIWSQCLLGQTRLGYSFNDSVINYPKGAVIIVETHPLVCMVCMQELAAFLDSDTVTKDIYILVKNYSGQKAERRVEARRYKGLFPKAVHIVFEHKSGKDRKRSNSKAYPNIMLRGDKETYLPYKVLFLPELNDTVLSKAILEMR